MERMTIDSTWVITGQKVNKKDWKMKTKLCVIFGVLILCGCNEGKVNWDFTDKDIKNEFSGFKNDLKCIETLSTNGKSKSEISFIGLLSESPRILTDNGSFPMKKVAETSETLTINWVAPSGSVSSYILHKKKGTFAHSALGEVVYLYSEASVGKCK